LGLLEQPAEVPRRRRRKIFRRQSEQFRSELRRVLHEGRLILLSALRHRRQIRRIRLDQQPVQRHGLDHGAQFFGILESHDARQ
jgi:hypothetical protein